MRSIIAIIILCLSFVLTNSVLAELSVNSIFSDNAVLQQGVKLPVWGWADDGTRVTVELCGQSAIAIAKDGKWSVGLDPLTAGGPYSMVITDYNTTIEINNILIGEVWICSGQSNMERSLAPLRGHRAIVGSAQAIEEADLPEIRQFKVEKRISYSPEFNPDGCSWSVCSPETAGKFTGVGFFFAREIYRSQKVPVGIIFAAWGGTIVESWTSADSLKTMPDYLEAVKEIEFCANADMDTRWERYYKQLDKWYEKYDIGSGKAACWSMPDTDISKWRDVSLPGSWENNGLGSYDGVIWYCKTVELPESWQGQSATINLDIIDDIDNTWVNGVKVGSSHYWKDKRSYEIPAELTDSGKLYIAVRVLDHGGNGGFLGKGENMYLECQGSSADRISLAGNWKFKATAGNDAVRSVPRRPAEAPTVANTATVLHNGMISPIKPYAIRGAIWYQGESNRLNAHRYRELFPLMIRDWREIWGQGEFPFIFTQIAPYRTIVPELREAQMMALTRSANTAMAVTTDVGEANDIHPVKKEPVGYRLALGARALAYGEDIVYSGPIYKAMSVKGDKAVLSFDHIGGGLIAKDGPLKGFTIAGQDGQFKPAQAIIKGNTVIVSSPEIAKPTAVRYGWANVPDVNLFNKEGLPASPFRTDD